MWGLFVSQGWLFYSVDLYMKPGAELPADRGGFVVWCGSGIFTLSRFSPLQLSTSSPLFRRQLLSAEGVRSGKRRYLVALFLF